MIAKFLQMFGISSSETVVPNTAPVALPTIRPPAVIQSVIVPTPIPQHGPRHSGLPVPYYPQRGPAVPNAAPAKVVETQSELIRNLRQASALSFDDFDAYIKPAIDNYARFVHLLPASEYDHHSDLGGLFRHGLEVALYASRRAEGKQFGLNEPASVRKFQFFRWRACVLLGAMLHDLGKAVIDVGAIDETGDLVWNPHVQPLWDWLAEHELQAYNVAWRATRRHREHDAISATSLLRIIPDETMRWLALHNGRVPYDAMLMALTGSVDRNNPLIDIIKHADSDSVEADKISQQKRMSSIGEGGSRGVGAQVVRAMRDRLLNGDWKVNEIGSPIWFTSDGLYALFPRAASEAIDHLRQAGLTFVPKDPQNLVQILADCGIITSHTSQGSSYSVHQIKLYVEDRLRGPMEATVQAIKLTTESILPDYYVLPSPVHVDLLEPDGSLRSHGTVTAYAGTGTPVPAPAPTEAPESSAPTPDVAPPKRGRGRPSESGVGKKAGSKRRTITEEASDLESVSDPFDDDASGLDGEPTVAATASPSPDGTPEAAPAVSPSTDTPLRDWGAEPDHRDRVISENLAVDRNPFPPVSIAGAQAWLAKQEENGPYLEFVLTRAREGELVWGKHLFNIDNHLHLIFPEAFDNCGTEPAMIRHAFEVVGWVKGVPPRPNQPTVLVTVHDQPVTCLRFDYGVSRALCLLLPPQKEAPPPPSVYGPYINGHRARVFTGQSTDRDVDALVLRCAMHDFLTHTVKGSDTPWQSFAGDELKNLIGTFAKAHNLTFNTVRVLLRLGENPLLTDALDDALAINPNYNHAMDTERLASTGEVFGSPT